MNKIVKRIMVIGLVMVGMTILFGCGGSEEPAEAPETSPPVKKTVEEPRSFDPDTGKKIFQEGGCTACHNKTEETLVGPGLATVYQKDTMRNGKPLTDDNVKQWITEGGGGDLGFMPGNPGLSDEELGHLVAFIKDLADTET